MAATKTLLQAIAVTAELMQTELSKPAASVMAADLSEYPEPWVLKALLRTRREVKGRLSIADVIARIEDGRPSPEEAWAMIPKDEADSVVWTDEMAHAWAIAERLMDAPVQARMAFLEKYRELVRQGREAKRPVHWWVTLGHDVQRREAVLLEAVECGRISVDHAQALLPALVNTDVVQRIAALQPQALEAP